MGLSEELLEDGSVRDAFVEQIKAETELHKIRAQAEAIKLDDLRRTEDTELARMKHHGEYLFYNPVIEQTVASAMIELFSWSKKTPEQPITVTFNSPGGYVTDGFTLFDFLRDLSAKGHKITTKCMGIAASMGAILMQAGDERVITPNAFFMVHEVQGESEGTTSQREEQLKIAKAFQARGLDILAERATLSRAEIAKRWVHKDWYMTAEEALKNGFIDRIEGKAAKRPRRRK